jgi:hypothetical protein
VAALAGLVIVLAVVFGVMLGNLPIPLWFRVLLPIVAVVSIFTGGRLVRPKHDSAT